MLFSNTAVASFPSSFRLPKETIGDLDAETAARIMASASDIAMVIDRDGIIQDLALSGPELPAEGLSDILSRRWIDTVTVESRHKVAEMLKDALGNRAPRWREVNQQALNGSIPFRYVALDAGRDGRVIALGRDLRGVELLQRTLLQTQQAMERDYARLRQAESRYRVLFQIASEPVLIVDPASRRIVEANPAAGNLLNTDYTALSGKAFAKLFHPECRDHAAALLSDASAAAQHDPVPMRLADGRDGYRASASLFRQEGAAHVLISLSAAPLTPVGPSTSEKTLLLLLNRIPDAIVTTDESLAIVHVNPAFLEMTQIANDEAARGQPLARFLGRPSVDLKVLIGNLRDHGAARNFGTVLRTVYGDQEEVELSAVSAREGARTSHCFVIRRSRAAIPPPSTQARGLPRTAEQMMDLVGRMSLREIVAETTGVIERMCIEAALARTGNNRVSAAELLGLSRQSLYSKLNRHGIANPDIDRE